MSTVGDEYPKQQARCRDLLLMYDSIGPAGAFGKAMIEQVLKRADEAALSGDPVAMIRCYLEMKNCE